MTGQSRYRAECGHCSYVATSVLDMEKHLKRHHDDRDGASIPMTQNNNDNNSDEDEDNKSDGSESDGCIRPDPEPEAEEHEAGLWEEWGADNVTLNYPRDVDDDPSYEHHMGSCDTDMGYFRNLYNDSLNEEEHSNENRSMDQTVAGSSSYMEHTEDACEAVSDGESGELSNPDSPLALTEAGHSEADEATEQTATKSPTGEASSKDHSYTSGYKKKSSTIDQDLVGLHLNDHQYSSRPKRPRLSESSDKLPDNDDGSSACSDTGRLDLQLIISSDDSNDGSNSLGARHEGVPVQEETVPNFFCAHCEFKSSVLSLVQQHTLKEHSETPKHDDQDDKEEASTWETVGDANPDTAANDCDEAEDWHMVLDRSEDEEYEQDGPTPIEITPLDDDAQVEERCFQCEINGCRAMFPLRPDFVNHVKYKHRQDNGKIYHCMQQNCWYAATSHQRVQQHWVDTHGLTKKGFPSDDADNGADVVDNTDATSCIPPDNRIPIVVAPIDMYEEKALSPPKTIFNKKAQKARKSCPGGQNSKFSNVVEVPFVDESDRDKMIQYECKINNCPAIFFKRELFSCHVKSDHIHEGGKVFYCAYCQFAATDHIPVKKHTQTQHTVHTGHTMSGLDLNLTPQQKRYSYRRAGRITICLYCNFTSREPHLVVYHTYREHRPEWMQQLGEMHPNFQALSKQLGILGALPHLRVEKAKWRTYRPEIDDRPAVVLESRTRGANIDFTHLVKTGGICEEGCKMCDHAGHRKSRATLATRVQEEVDTRPLVMRRSTKKSPGKSKAKGKSGKDEGQNNNTETKLTSGKPVSEGQKEDTETEGQKEDTETKGLKEDSETEGQKEESETEGQKEESETEGHKEDNDTKVCIGTSLLSKTSTSKPLYITKKQGKSSCANAVSAPPKSHSPVLAYVVKNEEVTEPQDAVAFKSTVKNETVATITHIPFSKFLPLTTHSKVTVVTDSAAAPTRPVPERSSLTDLSPQLEPSVLSPVPRKEGTKPDLPSNIRRYWVLPKTAQNLVEGGLVSLASTAPSNLGQLSSISSTVQVQVQNNRVVSVRPATPAASASHSVSAGTSMDQQVNKTLCRLSNLLRGSGVAQPRPNGQPGANSVETQTPPSGPRHIRGLTIVNPVRMLSPGQVAKKVQIRVPGMVQTRMQTPTSMQSQGEAHMPTLVQRPGMVQSVRPVLSHARIQNKGVVQMPQLMQRPGYLVATQKPLYTTAQGVAMVTGHMQSSAQGQIASQLQRPPLMQGPGKVQTSGHITNTGQLQSPPQTQSPGQLQLSGGIQSPVPVHGPRQRQSPPQIQSPGQLPLPRLIKSPVAVRSQQLQSPPQIQSPVPVHGPKPLQRPSLGQRPVVSRCPATGKQIMFRKVLPNPRQPVAGAKSVLIRAPLGLTFNLGSPRHGTPRTGTPGTPVTPGSPQTPALVGSPTPSKAMLVSNLGGQKATNIGVCNRGCSQHQILLLKNPDPNLAKVLLLHDLHGQVIHAETLNMKDLGIDVSQHGSPSPTASNGSSTVTSLTAAGSKETTLPSGSLVVKQALQGLSSQGLSPQGHLSRSPQGLHQQARSAFTPVAAGSPGRRLNQQLNLVAQSSSSTCSQSVLPPSVIDHQLTTTTTTTTTAPPGVQQSLFPPPQSTGLQIQDSAVSSTVTRIKSEPVSVNDVTVIEDEPSYVEPELDTDAPCEGTVDDNTYLYDGWDEEDRMEEEEEGEDNFKRLIEDDPSDPTDTSTTAAATVPLEAVIKARTKTHVTGEVTFKTLIEDDPNPYTSSSPPVEAASLPIRGRPKKQRVNDNHMDTPTSPATAPRGRPKKQLIEDDHHSLMNTSTSPTAGPAKGRPKKRKSATPSTIPVKRIAKKELSVKEVVVVQPMRVSSRERKHTMKCLCEECKLLRKLDDSDDNISVKAPVDTYKEMLRLDPKLNMKPFIPVPNIMCLLQS